MTLFLSYLINGISLGSVYAIIALGYTMVYGIAKMLNFAHGDVIMIGAYISFCATQYLGLPAIVSVVMAMAVCTVLGIVIEGLAYRPLRQAPSLAVLITAIGVSYLLQNVALLIWGSTPKNFTSVFSVGSISLFGGTLIITSETILTVLANIVIMIGLTAFIKAFTAAVFGGIGSIPGAMIGGILLGVIEILGKAYVSTELGDAFVFAVLIVVLLVKPAGLLGKQVREKV